MNLYIRLDVAFYRDPKFLRAGPLAAELYLRGCCFCMENLTDGFIAEEQLPLISIGLTDVEQLVERLLAQPRDGSRPLWEASDGGWRIPAFLDHNRSASEVAQDRENKRKAGLASGIARRTSNSTATACSTVCSTECSTEIEQKPNSPGYVSVSVPAVAVSSGSTRTSPRARVEPADDSAGAAPSTDSEPPDDNTWEPDDPAYRLDPAYTGLDDLVWWGMHIGKIQPTQRLFVQNAFVQLHRHCKRTQREIRAWLEHIASNDDARRFWGTGKSPAFWLRSLDGAEPTWRKVRAHWLAAGGHLPAPKPTGPDLGPEPPIDTSCATCGGVAYIADKDGYRKDCPDCARGRWLAAGGKRKGGRL